MQLDDNQFLAHYGTPRHSGRYPWGSGKNPQRNRDWITYVGSLRKQGMTDSQIAKAMGMKTNEFRAKISIARAEQRKLDVAEVLRLTDKGMSNVAIGERMGINESSVRNLKNEALQVRSESTARTAETLKRSLEKHGGYLDVGTGVERYLGVSRTKMDVAIAMLKEQGYDIKWVKVEQLGNPGNYTSIRVLTPPGTDYATLAANRDKIHLIDGYSDDNGATFKTIKTPRSIDSNRVKIRYAEEGGKDKDGVIELRRGVPELAMDKRYAQVRIDVDGTHYLKGMAVYGDNMPKGVDIIYNTNKAKDVPKMDVMKDKKSDADLPFGAIVRQKTYLDSSGKEQLSALNIVGYKDNSGEEGAWGEWAKTLSSQMLSKQEPALAKRQLDLAYANKADEFNEIKQITNPAVKRSMLESFADDCDASSTHLKAAALPRQRTHVILPLTTIKDNEVYAPNYRPGEKVVLIRYPHGGIFEIPDLKVNNKNPEGKKLLGAAADAVGISPKVAEQLSGADFDGDTVLVIPNPKGINIKTSAPLKALKNFDPKESYPPFDGMRTIDGGTYNAKLRKVEYPDGRPNTTPKQQQMGNVSNLITDMTIKGAPPDEIARAVRHSMVVIDSEKHALDYKRSAIDNGISQLKERYQGGANRGASTLISRADSDLTIPERKPRSYREGGPIDPKTGEKVYTYTGESYTKRTVKKDGTVVETQVPLTSQTKKGLEYTPQQLSAGTKIEKVYENYATSLKTLANAARKESLTVKPTPVSKTAKEAYKEEVASLNKKLDVALRNSPRERQAQLIANVMVDAKKKANPELKSDKSALKKVRTQALADARLRTGAAKERIVPTDREWEAIQSGAVSQSKLTQILANSNQDRIKELATPRSSPSVSSSKLARAKAMIAAGHTQAEVADALGISVSTILKAL